ncbi:unnamed protein product [Gordionus sp. m RMFG-2023]
MIAVLPLIFNSDIYGSKWLMNMCSLYDKSYHSQLEWLDDRRLYLNRPLRPTFSDNTVPSNYAWREKFIFNFKNYQTKRCKQLLKKIIRFEVKAFDAFIHTKILSKSKMNIQYGRPK